MAINRAQKAFINISGVRLIIYRLAEGLLAQKIPVEKVKETNESKSQSK